MSGKNTVYHTNDNKTTDNVSYQELLSGVYSALETYANVHRGSGYNSVVTTYLYEQARELVLQYLNLSPREYTAVFTTALGAGLICGQLSTGQYQKISSTDIGLPLGVHVVALRKNVLEQITHIRTGGGTARLVAPDWVVWAKSPDRFEAGTPAVINCITLVRALLLLQKADKKHFTTPLSAAGSDKQDPQPLEQLSGKALLTALQNSTITNTQPVPTVKGMQHFTYLDNSASTPAFTPVFKAFTQALSMAKNDQQLVIARTRTIAATFFGAPEAEYELLFTGNTTEAINLAAENLKPLCTPESGATIVNTLSEHNSNELPWRTIPNAKLINLHISKEGIPDIGELEQLLQKYNGDKTQPGQIKLVAVTGSSNVLGICNDITAISKLAHRYGAELLIDAAQLAAHRPVHMQEMGIDYLAFSGHKTYAPFGSGMLIMKKSVNRLRSAAMQAATESGEENAAGIAALGKALELLGRIGWSVITEEEQELTRHLLTEMGQLPGMSIHGVKHDQSPAFPLKSGVVAFEYDKMMAIKTARLLAEQGAIGLRAGCHCAHILIKHRLGIPPFFQRVQKLIVTILPKVELPGVARVSLGIQNTRADIDKFIETIKNIKTAKVTPEAKKQYKQQMQQALKTKRHQVFGE